MEAVKIKNFEMVQWLATRFPNYEIGLKVVGEAARQGLLQVLQFFRNQDHRFREGQTDLELTVQGRRVDWFSAMPAAAKAHRGDIVWWLHKHLPVDELDLDGAFEEAVVNGEIPLAKWLIDLGANWIEYVQGHIACKVAPTGRLDVLQWLDEQGRLDGAFGLVVKAAQNGHIEVIRWLFERDSRSDEERGVDLGKEARFSIHSAAVHGYLEVAKCLHEHASAEPTDMEGRIRDGEYVRNLERELHSNEPGFVTQITMTQPVKNGHMDVVQWLYREFGDEPYRFLFGRTYEDEDEEENDESDNLESTIAPVMDVAAFRGHLDILQYLHDIQKLCDQSAKKRKRDDADKYSSPKCTKGAMNGAASHGHLDIVRWLHDNRTEGCSAKAMDGAATNGYLDVVKWLFENRFEGCSIAAMDGAATNGHLEVVQWLHKHTTAGCTTKAMDGAASKGYLDVVNWLYENRDEGCTRDAMSGAAGRGALNIVKWLYVNRGERYTIDAMDKAVLGNRLHVAKWLRSHGEERCSSIVVDSAALYNFFEVFLFLESQCSEKCTAQAATWTYAQGSPYMNTWSLEQYPDFRDAVEAAFDVVLDE